MCPLCSRALYALLPHVPHALRALVPHVLVPYVLYVLHALVLHVPHVIRASYLTCPTCFMCLVPNVLLCLMYLTWSCISRVLCFVYSRADRASNSACSFTTRPSLVSSVSSLSCFYASHVLQLSCIVPLVLLFLQLLEFFTVFESGRGDRDEACS